MRCHLSWADVLQCLKCILHLTAPSAAEHSLAVQGLLSQGLLPASVQAWGAAQAAGLLLREVQCALLDTWVQLLAQMPAQPTGSDEAATLAQVLLSILKEAAVLIWQSAMPDAQRYVVAQCRAAVARATTVLRGLLRVWPHARDLLPSTDWPLLAAAVAPLLLKDHCLGRCGSGVGAG